MLSISASPTRTTKMHSDDRVLELKTIDGLKPVATNGLVDPRLFTGDNKLHAIRNPQTCLWTLKYDQGGLPPVLKQQFTTFSMLLKFVTDYYRKRNITIKEIIE